MLQFLLSTIIIGGLFFVAVLEPVTWFKYHYKAPWLMFKVFQKNWKGWSIYLIVCLVIGAIMSIIIMNQIQ